MRSGIGWTLKYIVELAFTINHLLLKNFSRRLGYAQSNEINLYYYVYIYFLRISRYQTN